MNISSALSTYKKANATDVEFSDSPHELIRIVFKVLLENLEKLEKTVVLENTDWQKPF